MGKQHTKQATADSSTTSVRYRSAAALALGGGLVLFAAFPPLGLAPLAWIAPVFFLFAIKQAELRGRRAWLGVWAASAVHWLLMIQGIRLAHWANYFGWFALAAYLAVYLPVFFWLTRVAVQQARIPLLIAAPVVWTGLELARGHLITGFSMGLLGHALVEWTTLIQISDLFGAYGVSFLIVLVAAAAVECLPSGRCGWRWSPALVGVATLVCTWGYGYFRLSPTGSRPPEGRPLKVALLQGTVDKVFEYDPQRNVDTFQGYLALAKQARDAHPDLDLIVWPESVFTGTTPDLLAPPADQRLPAGPLSEAEYRERIGQGVAYFEEKTRLTAARINRLQSDGRPAPPLNIHLIAGTETVVFDSQGLRIYNSALLIDPQGTVLDRYYKMHPVMFGEYIPFGEWFPWLYRITPLPQGLSVGDGPRAFEVVGWRMSPSVCFESSVPHLIRGHVRGLQRERREPDILVNVSDDGWFWGSSILDLQLAGAVFRAVELRRPCLVAANAGLSAYIDGDGRIVQRGQRGRDGVLIAEVQHRPRFSPYLQYGDLPAGVCLAFCIAIGLLPLSSRWLRRHTGSQSATPPSENVPQRKVVPPEKAVR